MLLFWALILGLLANVRGDCGCLKCSKGLTVISPPSSPVKVILRGKLPAKAPPSYFNQYGLPPRPPTYASAGPIPLYGAQVQIPYIPPPPTPLITPLAPAPDRIVLPAPDVEAAGACPFSSSGPIMDTVAIPPPCDDRPTITLQEVPLYPQYAYPSYCPCQGYVLSPESKVRAKRSLIPRHRRPPIHHHTPLSLLRTPFHFFLRTVPKLLAFPVVQFFRMLAGPQHHDPLLRPGGLYGYDRPRSGDLLQSSRRYPSELESRRYRDFEVRDRRFKPAPPKSILISKLKKINELTRDVAETRMKRSLAFDVDGEWAPFYKVDERDDGGSWEDNEVEGNDEIVGGEFLKPFHFEHIVPHKPIFYLLNTPIRILSHLDNLKNQIRPVVSTIPLVLQNSRKYLIDFGKEFHNHILDFASNLIGDFDHAPHFRPLRPLLPKGRYKRSASIFAQLLQKTEEDSFERQYLLAHDPLEYTKTNRSKRFILKMVDEKEVEEFLKEKLGDDAPVRKKVAPAAPRRKLVIEPLTPKLIVDKKGKTFVEMNGLKRPFLSKRKNKFRLHESDDINNKITDLIEQAKASAQIVGASYDSSMHHQVVKDKIKQTLTDIDDLINTDFTKYIALYEDLRKLQNLKSATVDDWKTLLINKRINELEAKIPVLNSFKQIQTNRAAILANIVAMLEERSFMASRLIKMLVRLQKLQCVVYSVVEDFGERIHARTLFDPQREIRYVDYLDGINFVNAKTREELEGYLKKERDDELERRIKVLERLRGLLEEEDVGKINEEARLLWEMKNIEKLQQDSIKELNVMIARGQKVRKELKILFDLQRQLEAAERKQEELLKDDEVVEMRLKPKKNEIVGARLKPKRQTKAVKITPLARTSSLLSRTLLRDKKPVKVVADGYTVVGYITKRD